MPRAFPNFSERSTIAHFSSLLELFRSTNAPQPHSLQSYLTGNCSNALFLLSRQMGTLCDTRLKYSPSSVLFYLYLHRGITFNQYAEPCSLGTLYLQWATHHLCLCSSRRKYILLSINQSINIYPFTSFRWGVGWVTVELWSVVWRVSQIRSVVPRRHRRRIASSQSFCPVR